MFDIHVLALDATRKGGAGVYTTRLIAELARRGHRVTLVCHEATPDVKAAATVHEIPRVPSARPFGLWRLSSFLQLRDYDAMLRALPLGRADMVIGSAQPLAWAYARQFPDVPMVYLPHSLVAPLELASYGYPSRVQRLAAVRAYHYLERDCLRRARTTIRFTRAAAAAFASHYGARLAQRIAVLPMPIDVPSGGRTPRTGAPRLLLVGRLIESKNVGFLVELLARQAGLPWTLDVVGSGPLLEPLRSAVHAHGLDARITFHGHRDDVAGFYRNADAFVFPSLLENSPVVLLEAMSHALPTLSFHPDGVRIHGANHEIVEHGVTGLLARDERQFEALLADLLNGDADLAGMGAAAQRAVLGRNSWGEHVARIESLVASTPQLDRAAA